MIAAGFFAGLLPLIHAHTFLVIMGVGACLMLLFRASFRNWFVFFAVAVIVALPQLLWLGQRGGGEVARFVARPAGWGHGQLNAAPLWVLNTRPFIPLLVMAVPCRHPP